MVNYRSCRGCPTADCHISKPKIAPQVPTSTPPCCEYAIDELKEIDGLPLGMSYVPFQKFENLYDIDAGFTIGTIFKDLDKPFCGRCQK